MITVVIVCVILLSFQGSSSDADDLQLGAEATDLRRKHKTHKHPPPLRFVYYCTISTDHDIILSWSVLVPESCVLKEIRLPEEYKENLIRRFER